MPDPALTAYIRQNLAANFSESEIETALRQSGWPEPDIREAFLVAQGDILEKTPLQPDLPQEPGFFARHVKLLIIVVAVVIGVPLLTWGGYALYQTLHTPATPPAAPQTINQQVQGASTAAATRDLQRLTDVQNLQTALDQYQMGHKFYPGSLDELVAQKFLLSLPTDPQTNAAYLYSALGQPALHYSLSFLLEQGLGTLKSGFNVVSSEYRLPADAIRQQNLLFTGQASANQNTGLTITDLAQSPFYPQEEVTLQVHAGKTITLVWVRMQLPGLHLTTNNAPFQFRFTAPAAAGTYPVQVFGFDKTGQSYSVNTMLTVRPR